MRKLENLINFIVVGTAKAGTTSLFYTIKKHPKIFIPEQKEMYFFDHKNINSKKGATKKFTDYHNNSPHQISNIDDYMEFYKNVKKGLICGDITASYLYNYKYSIPEIKAHCAEDVKIIIILRNPVERTYSQYLHGSREGFETLSFFDSIKQEEKRKNNNYSYNYFYKDYGNYYEQVKAFLENFQNVKIYFYEDLFSEEFYKDFFDFIQVKPIKISKTPIMNKTGIPKSIILQKILDLVRYNRSIVKFFKFLGFEKLYLKIKYSNLKKPEMDLKSREYLKSYFKSDLQKLEKLLSKDLSHWYK